MPRREDAEWRKPGNPDHMKIGIGPAAFTAVSPRAIRRGDEVLTACIWRMRYFKLQKAWIRWVEVIAELYAGGSFTPSTASGTPRVVASNDDKHQRVAHARARLKMAASMAGQCQKAREVAQEQQRIHLKIIQAEAEQHRLKLEARRTEEEARWRAEEYALHQANLAQRVADAEAHVEREERRQAAVEREMAELEEAARKRREALAWEMAAAEREAQEAMSRIAEERRAEEAERGLAKLKAEQAEEAAKEAKARQEAEMIQAQATQAELRRLEGEAKKRIKEEEEAVRRAEDEAVAKAKAAAAAEEAQASAAKRIADDDLAAKQRAADTRLAREAEAAAEAQALRDAKGRSRDELATREEPQESVPRGGGKEQQKPKPPDVDTGGNELRLSLRNRWRKKFFGEDFLYRDADMQQQQCGNV